jgi:hypothetical protein
MLAQAIYEQVGASCGGRENAGAGVTVNKTRSRSSPGLERKQIKRDKDRQWPK